MAKSVGLNRSGGKRNLTIQLDEETIQAAKELAVRRNTSVSGLLAQKVKEMVEADRRYEAAKRRAIDAMHTAKGLGGGGITWTREELNEERINAMEMFKE
jgi:hypothetical protein